MSETRRKPSNGLTAAFVRAVREPGKYHDGKGTGLFLLVKPSGSRSWVQRIMVRGVRRELGLGSPPVVLLAEAREAALDNKRCAYAGGDPRAERRKARATPTFEEAARKTHVELAPTWKNPKDRAAFLNTLAKYIFPRIGRTPISDVTSADIRQTILAAREKVPGVAHKLTYRVSFVFRWAIAEGHCTMNPATAQALALPRVERTPSHRKALLYSEVANCIDVVMASGAGETTKLALEFLILTATRSGETRQARWQDFEFHGGDSAARAIGATWTIPAHIAKSKRPFRVPISKRALEILRRAEALSDGSVLVFPGAKRGRPLSDMTLSKLVKKLGFNADVHGFRTSFRTWAQEQTNFAWEVAEAAMQHKVGTAVEQAYARSDVFEKRRMMMDGWSRYLRESAVAEIKEK